MYVTRPLSLYRRSPDALSTPPPQGPNSGYLVIQDEEPPPACCFGVFKDSEIKGLPFPQDKLLVVHHHSSDAHFSNPVYMIPVINQPLSLNRYYVIKAHGSHKGNAYTSSKEEDISANCFMCKSIQDVKPRALNPQDTYQQFELSTHQSCTNKSSFLAKSVASDGFPPRFLRRQGWNINSKAPTTFFSLNEANGIDSALRTRLPSFDFSSSNGASEPVVVGKWYVPFMFIKEKTAKEQVKKSVFYEMTLEQRWERIFACENTDKQGKSDVVTMDVVVPTEVVKLGGKDALRDVRDEGSSTSNSKFVRFQNIYNSSESVGLSSLVVERMMWEEERAGWVHMEGKHVRGVRTEEYGGIGWWAKFSCYVLVERFVLKRTDGSSVLTYDFMHTHQFKSKWE
ncbi:hypothetical protein V2J09_005543 [Rumex salicifolius]